MSTQIELQNYLITIRNTENDEVALKTTIQGFRRFKGDFMLLDLYQEYSLDYQKEEYPDTIELKQTKEMETSLMSLLIKLNSKTLGKDLHLHKGKDGAYLCYPPRISSWEEAEEIIKKWFIATYFHIKTGCDPNYLESFGHFILNLEGLSTDNSQSLIDDYVEWIKDIFHLEIIIEKLL